MRVSWKFMAICVLAYQSRVFAQPPNDRSSSITSTPTYDPARHYSGSEAEWTQLLLVRNTNWSCPTTPGASSSSSGFDKGVNKCMRDSYVWSAVLLAWGAECESRFSRDSVAKEDAVASVQMLTAAAKLCSSNPVIGSTDADATCSTEKIVACSEIRNLIPQSQSQQEQALKQQQIEDQILSHLDENQAETDRTRRPQDDVPPSPSNGQSNESLNGPNQVSSPNLIQQTAEHLQQQFNDLANKKSAPSSRTNPSSGSECTCGHPCNKPGAHPAC